MRWVLLCLGVGSTALWSRRVRRLRVAGAARRAERAYVGFAALLCAGLLGGMGMQLVALRGDGLLDVRTALPLHLCSFSAVLAVPALCLRARPLADWLWLLGAPCALLALCFPAILPTSRPLLTAAGFYLLHSALLCAPLYLRLAQGLPLPGDPRGVLLGGLLLLACVAAFDRLTGCNYLFLLRAPAGTPLVALAARGPACYAAALTLLAMALTTVLSAGYARLEAQKAAPDVQVARDGMR